MGMGNGKPSVWWTLQGNANESTVQKPQVHMKSTIWDMGFDCQASNWALGHEL